MKHVLRLLLILLLCSQGVAAWAYACSNNEWQMYGGTWTQSKAAAANSFMGSNGKIISNCGPGNPFTLYNHHVVNLGPDTTNTFTAVYAYCNDSNVFSTEHTETLSMRASNGQCVCQPPLIDDGTGCKDPCASKKGAQKDVNFGLGGTQGSMPSGMGPKQACDPLTTPGGAGFGCYAFGSVTAATWLTPNGANYSYGGLPGGQWAGWARMSYSGTFCALSTSADGNTGPATVTADPAANPKAAPSTCPEGQFPGTVGGVATCAPPSDRNSVASTGTSTSSVTATNPDGSTSTSTTGKSTSTLCVNSVCTTTTTTTVTNSTGSGTPTVTTSVSNGTQTLGEFCKSDPKASACKGDQGSFGGSCDSSFTCSGDAATCAIATSVNKSRCLEEKFVTEDAALKQAGADAISNGSSAGTGSATVSLSASDINQTNPFSATCPADKILTLHGVQVALPLSQGCDALKAMGALLVAVALIVAARIVGSA